MNTESKTVALQIDYKDNSYQSSFEEYTPSEFKILEKEVSNIVTGYLQNEHYKMTLNNGNIVSFPRDVLKECIVMIVIKQ